ncbi:hypothetical protein N4G58_18575 [Edwardsiella piscicida]|nr:hypothetical protein N4G58_18575 [Edwardsiella piscicida]
MVPVIGRAGDVADGDGEPDAGQRQQGTPAPAVSPVISAAVISTALAATRVSTLATKLRFAISTPQALAFARPPAPVP